MNADAPQKERHEMPRGVEMVMVTRVRELVGDFKIRRALPDAKRRLVGPFIFLDQIGPEVLKKAVFEVIVRCLQRCLCESKRGPNNIGGDFKRSF